MQVVSQKGVDFPLLEQEAKNTDATTSNKIVLIKNS